MLQLPFTEANQKKTIPIIQSSISDIGLACLNSYNAILWPCYNIYSKFLQHFFDKFHKNLNPPVLYHKNTAQIK